MVDPAGEILNVEGLDIASVHDFDDLAELSGIVAEADAAKGCFSRQYFRYARGYHEEPIDECAIESSADTLKSSGSIREMMISVTQSNDFTNRQ